ncbi:MAG: gamma-glutamyltransferase [Candidatus Kryptoniota bacterium]
MKIAYKFLFLLIIPASTFGQISQLKPATSRNGMVVSSDSIATSVGVEILREGGNAVDAAVAVGFALAVTYPQAGNLGGGGYYLIHTRDGKNFAIDARETAPSRAAKGMFLDVNGNVIPKKSLLGGASAGVPGNVDGLILAEEKFGRLSLKQVIKPAIDLAGAGFRINRRLSDAFKAAWNEFKKFPSTMKYFSRNGNPYVEGDTLVQKDLARVLRKISQEGRSGFYNGEVPQLIAETVHKTGGIMTAEDIENYHSLLKEPVSVIYRGYDVVSMPPSSSGGVALAEMFNILKHFDLKKYGYGASQSLHYEIEAMRRAYADRDRFLGDDAFVQVPVHRLISDEYADSISMSIDTFYATPSSRIYPELIHPVREGDHTTHYSVIDKEGNAVSVTTTLNSYFGGMVVVDGAGFFLNNEMDDFSVKPGIPNQFGAIGGDANSIEPGKRMLSSMTPTIVLERGKPFLILGSPGGTTIINSVLEVILNVVDYNMSLVRAIMAPRVHHQWVPDEVFYEPGSLVYDVKQSLKSRGYKLVERPFIGEVQAIEVMPDGEYEGVADPRGGGTAEGY